MYSPIQALKSPFVCPAQCSSLVDNMAMNNVISPFGTHIHGWWFEISCCDLTLLWGAVKSWKPFSPTYASVDWYLSSHPFLHPVATMCTEWL